MADFASLPKVEAGCQMPSAHAIAMSDQTARLAAEMASKRLLERMLAYYAKHHPGTRS